ncbi:hypothetical protein L208DRAFT_535918 [Tricholoma matsutake]|nr:hypothetical protein L208DRAFT_535918 [Tricholoma matsutake 945]
MGHQPRACLSSPQQDLPCQIPPIPPTLHYHHPLPCLGKPPHVQGLSSENQNRSTNQDLCCPPPNQIHYHRGSGLWIWVEWVVGLTQRMQRTVWIDF